MKIILSGGGTMGPVTPLLAVAEELSGHELLWIGRRHGPERQLVEAAGIRFRAIHSGKLRRYFDIRTLIDAFLIVAGFFESLALLVRWHPDVIVSAGGYVSVPVVWAGWILRVPSVIHQQDVKPLLAVRLMAPFARKITTAFPETVKQFHSIVYETGGRVEVTGNPVRRFVEWARRDRQQLRRDGLRRFGLSGDRPVVLIFGGGTGAQALNDFLDGACDELAGIAQVIHVTGKGKTVRCAPRPGLVIRDFLTVDLPYAYAVADLAVSRAGMGAISELSAVGLPAILVPIPGTHQEENAGVLGSRNAAVVVREGPMFRRELLKAITRLLDLPARRAELSDAIHRILPSAARQRLADIVRRVAKR